MWFLGVIAMGCHIDGIVVNTADTQIRCEGGSARGAIVNSGKKKKKKRRQKEASFKPNSCWVWTDKCELVLEISYGKRNTSLYDNSQMQHIPANLALHFPAGCGSSLLINLAMICVAERPPCQQGYCLDAVSAHPFDLQCLLQPPAVTSTAHKLKSCQEAVILAGY